MMPTHRLVKSSLFFLVVLVAFDLSLVVSEENDSSYFYLSEPDSPVLEFATPKDGNVWENHEFLWKPTPNVHRIVEFYAPWCPHCQQFKNQFVSLAKKLKTIAQEHQITVEVYGVSCVDHKPVCRYYNVHSYPAVHLFLANQTNGTSLDIQELHPFVLLTKMGLKHDVTLEHETIAEPKVETTKMRTTSRMSRHDEHDNAVDANFFLPRQKSDIFQDAFLSFQFTMKNAIFTRPGPLEPNQKESLEEFLLLLQSTMPPTFRLRDLITQLLDNRENGVFDSEENLVAIVDQHPANRNSWSYSCTRGVSGMGYTCGLWELFHIMSIGLVEWNNLSLVDDFATYRPDEPAEILRNFIDHFFGCEVCRIHFLDSFDNCGYDRCNRLISDVGDMENWIEFPLWLYEFHNGVNVRLFREKAEREGRVVSEQDEVNVIWPSKADCPSCWHSDGRWNPDHVYMFLRLTYWANDDVAKKMRRNLNGEDVEDLLDEEEQARTWVLFEFLLVVLLLFGVSVARSQLHKSNGQRQTKKLT